MWLSFDKKKHEFAHTCYVLHVGAYCCGTFSEQQTGMALAYRFTIKCIFSIMTCISCRNYDKQDVLSLAIKI